MHSHHDVVVIGAGQAGLATAHHLQKAGADFVVLEQGVVGDSWVTHRWDSFALNTPNHTARLPGAPYTGDDDDGFMTHLELVESFRAYIDTFALPVREGTEVTDLRHTDGMGFELDVRTEGGAGLVTADAVVVASGILREPNIPSVSRDIPSGTLQIPAAAYRNPGALPEGAVLVVGGAQTGGQIVEDLLHAGRDVYWSISNATRAPRRYRGRDTVDWMIEVGLLDIRTEDAEPKELAATNPLISGVGRRGHSLSYQWLGRMGAHLIGRITMVEDGRIVTDGQVPHYIAQADDASAEIKSNIDAYIGAHGIDAPEPEDDPADDPVGSLDDLRISDTVDVDAIAAIVWATGYRPRFDWIDLPVFDDRGHPVHTNGSADIDGLYFMGFPWLTKRKSGIIYGVDEDAALVTADIMRYLALRTPAQG